MSTTFGIKIPSIDDDEEEEIQEIAFSSSYMRWTNPVAQLLPDELEVIALDNDSDKIGRAHV